MSPPDLAGCAIAFDLDGTLVDTAPDLHRCLNTVLLGAGLEPVPLESVRAIVGHGARALIDRAMRLQGAQPSVVQLDAHTRDFIEDYRSDIARMSRVFDGVGAALEELRSREARLVVCTNKLTSLSEALLERTGLAVHFEAVVGSDAVTRRKPDPEHFLQSVSRVGAEAGRSLMVGDSINDVLSARSAGAPVLVATFGYTDIPAYELGADAVFSSYAEVPALAKRFLATA